MSDLKHFAPVLDDKDILHQRDDMAPHLIDWRGQFDGAAPVSYTHLTLPTLAIV